ncbi:MAG: alpha/beta fold hydrolase [Flavobacteriales bacterium]|nr:alpha/beta fold hydrolase [Flavobacteriales bacterium]
MILNHKIIGEGKPLYILHGLFGSLDNWNSLGKKFGEDRRVILVDQRNHGRSFHHEEMNYKVMAQDLTELMDHLGDHRADLLGHSMGGKTVMRAAIDQPNRVDRLIVADIGPQDYPSHHEAILEALFAVDIDSIRTRSEAQTVISEYVKDQGVVQFLAKNLYWKEKGVLSWKMNLHVIAESMDEILSTIGDDVYQGRTLFLRGRKSDYIIDSMLMPLHMQFTKSEVYTIEEAGHWLHSERPEEFFDAVSGFLNNSAL